MKQVHVLTLTATMQAAFLELARQRPNEQLGASAGLLSRVCNEVIERSDGHSLIRAVAIRAVTAAIEAEDAAPWRDSDKAA